MSSLTLLSHSRPWFNIHLTMSMHIYINCLNTKDLLLSLFAVIFMRTVICIDYLRTYFNVVMLYQFTLTLSIQNWHKHVYEHVLPRLLWLLEQTLFIQKCSCDISDLGNVILTFNDFNASIYVLPIKHSKRYTLRLSDTAFIAFYE